MRRTVRVMDKLNPLKNVATKQYDTRSLPAPLPATVEVSARNKRKVDRRAAKLAAQKAKDDAKAAKARETNERQAQRDMQIKKAKLEKESAAEAKEAAKLDAQKAKDDAKTAKAQEEKERQEIKAKERQAADEAKEADKLAAKKAKDDAKTKEEQKSEKLFYESQKDTHTLTSLPDTNGGISAGKNNKLEELIELGRWASYDAKKEANYLNKPPVTEPQTTVHSQTVYSYEAETTTLDYLHDFSKEPIPKTKKELKALILKLNDANKELRTQLLEQSLAEPARAAGLLMAKAALTADQITEQASRERDNLIKETVDTLIRTLDAVRSDLTTTMEQAGKVAADTLRNLKVR